MSANSLWHCYDETTLAALHAPTKDLLGLYGNAMRLWSLPGYLTQAVMRVRINGNITAFGCYFGMEYKIPASIMDPRMWPSQGVGKVFLKSICYLLKLKQEMGLFFTRGFDPKAWTMDPRRPENPYYLPLHQMAPDRAALDSYAPTIRIQPGAEYKRHGLGPYYGILMLMGLICIGVTKEELGFQYHDIFCHDLDGEGMTINIRPFKNALQPLHLKTPALEYLDMLLDSSSPLIFNNGQLHSVEDELIYHAFNAPACIENAKNLLAR